MLGDSGSLAAVDESYRARPSQLEMAGAVSRALEERTALVVEAGTGVGKTYAYLAPLLLSGGRALVSTATKGLQDQLFLRDLPRLKSALDTPARLALLKGRASYLCLYRLGKARHDAQLPDRWSVRTLARVESWSRATRSGDLAELEGLDDRSPVIPLVTSTRDNCLGTECPDHAACHVVRARREAMAADIVVVNHHLFFADLALRDSGVAELLPTVDAVVFDEAHQLVEAGLQFHGSQLASSQVVDLCRDVLSAGMQHARGLQPWAERCASLEQGLRELRLACAGPMQEIRSAVRLRWQDRASGEGLARAIRAVADGARNLEVAVRVVEGSAPDFARLGQRLEACVQLCERLALPPSGEVVRWIDLSPGSVRLVESPLDIRRMLGEQRQQGHRAWVFTSATLGDDEGMTWFTRDTGLEDARLLRVDSPFDYRRQARLWVPRSFPKPQDAAHPREVGRLAARCATALGGRCFVLTTTLRVLPAIAQALREALDLSNPGTEVLVQGSAPRRQLMQQFGDGRSRVLVGSHSFWEGIDVPGDALQCVVIDKLPFPPPSDPLVEARVRRIESRGGDAFAEHFVAEAAIALRQGGGRLIRTETDRGLLVICDPRLVRMPYGSRLRGALPPMQEVGDEASAMAWLAELAADHR